MNKKTGSIGVAGCFSFYPTKNITTLEGGMITTNDEEVAKRAKLLRSHAMTKTALEREISASWFYDIVDLGYNYRMNEIQAALGISQLKRIDDANKMRIQAANHYNKELSKIKGIYIPYMAENRTHVYHLYVIKVVKEEYGLSRDELFQYLSTRGIRSSVHYTPLHLLDFYRKSLNYKPGDFPIAEYVYDKILSLPMFPTITEKQINYVINKIKDAQNFSNTF